ncbi:MAG: efflux RND transporter periplasmic adaptor subunit [Candidatus Gastranaerophilales bacterium]|nr:efflux RND transporter periplasmic adaptor subunit [Candidatus Gastranaerophilales bacterium]
MNKKRLFITIAVFIAVLGILLFIVTRPEPEIIQGEVETQTIDVSSKIAGRILDIPVEKGDVVKKGQLLVKLDTPDIQAKAMQSSATLDLAMAENQKVNTGARAEQIAMAKSTMQQAEAGLSLASKTYKRLQNLHKDGVVATQKLDEAQAAYNNALNAVATARSNYQMLETGSRSEDKMAAGANVRRAQGAVSEVASYLKENTLKAPINGEITEISAEKGELVGTGYPIITIVNLDDVWVTFNIREDLLSKIKIGTIINAKIPALGNKEIPLKVNYISVLGNFATWKATKAKGDFDLKTFEVRAKPLNKIDALRAGMSAIVNWDKIK